MPEIHTPPKRRKRKFIARKKCALCKCEATYREGDRVWTEYGNTEARCAGCDAVIFLGRLGLPDSY